MRVCAAGLCIWSRQFVYVRTYISKYVYIYIYIACSLSLNASSVVCYIQRAIQTEQFMPFQIRREGPLGPEIFSYELWRHTTPSGLAASTSSCVATASVLCMHGRLVHAVHCGTTTTSMGSRCTCSTLNWRACSVHTGYVFFGTLVIRLGVSS